MQLSEKQLACVEHCLNTERRLAAVTGQAGTGKTTIIQNIAQRLEAANISYAVAAPTGKAAKRIREATGLKAVTVHKLLEYGRPGERDPKTGEAADITTPKRDRGNPFSQSVILVDEYSMVNHELHTNLVAALPRQGRLIAFGDLSQLNPIEKYELKNEDGSPFRQLLRIKGVAFELEEVFRQVDGSDVLTAATAVRHGQMPKRGPDFRMHLTDQPVHKLRDIVFDHLENGIDFGSIENQILVTMRERWIGSGPLNTMLRGLLNPNGKSETVLRRHQWDEKNQVAVSIGDKVVCTSNTYDMRDYTERYTEWKEDGTPEVHSFIPTPETKYMLNGETGKIIEIYPDGGLEIDFGDRVVEVPNQYVEYWQKRDSLIDTYPQRDIDLAYALTVHKAQGSEYQNVMYVINKSVFFMLSRENMYTALTRARKSVDLICDQSSLTMSIRTTQEAVDKKRAAHRDNKGSLLKK